MSGTTATGARPPQRGGPMGRGPMGGGGAPVEKSLNFVPSAKRLMGRLRPERFQIIAVTILAAIGVLFSVLGPKILGQGTNIIFEGFILRK